MAGEEREKVVGLIEMATNSTAAEVDPRLLKAIKSVVRYSDSELRLAAQTLMSFMKRDHSQTDEENGLAYVSMLVRYLVLLIIDELFMRSKLFRTLLVENLDQLLSLSIGFRRNLPLPAPASVASVLRSKAINLLEKWNETFGIHYRQLRLGYEYLKNTLRFQFPNLQANAARIQQERRGREMRMKDILLKKFEALKTNLASIKDEIQATIEEISECLDIVKTKDEDMPLVPTDDEEIEEFRNSELRQIRLDSLKEGERVQENSENKVVFDALRELYKVLVTKHLAAIQEWISILTRVETADTQFRDSTLKEFIDIRNHVQLVKRKCEESGCKLLSIANAEEDVWEEGSVESFVSRRSDTIQSDECTPVLTSNDGRNEDPRCRNDKSNKNEKKNHNLSGSESNPSRSKLLAEAPVVKWGSFLDSWGSNQDVLANQRGLDLEGHWGRVDNDAVIPAEKIAELNIQTSVYKEDPVEILPCRAPLRKGGLCQRRDLRVCPFHGMVIPRDDEGKPINQSSPVEETVPEYQQEEGSPFLESNVMEQLINQAVKNVLERDKEEVKKREYEKRVLKRAKLAKVRDHNEAVLRDAALASTSRSSHIGEDVEVLNGSKPSTKSKKQTLASMLKKKGVKDRLSQRLLNSRASDATVRQLTVAEDANYREAFPNQW